MYKRQDIKNTTNLTVAVGGNLIVASDNSSEYTALTDIGDHSIFTIRNDYFSNDADSFLPGGSNAAYGPIELWNTGAVTNMQSLFSSKGTFNKDISAWDVSNVTSMNQMFRQALVFNQPLGSWDTAKVNTFRRMFNNAKKFNQPIGTWNVSAAGSAAPAYYSARAFEEMFYYALNFNQSIADWERVTGQPLPSNTAIIATSTSTVGNVPHMGSMFNNATNFNQPIDNWDVSAVTTMQNMFRGSSLGTNEGNTKFNQYLGSWGNKFTSFPFTSFMFRNCAANVVQGIPETPSIDDDPAWVDYTWPITPLTASTDSSVGSIVWARDQWFTNSTQFNAGEVYAKYGTIDKWNTSQVTDMQYLFNGKATFNEDITAWDVSSVTDMSYMFSGAKAFNQDIGAWTINSGEGVSVSMSGMFDIYQPTSTFSNLNIGNWERENGVNGATSTSTMANVVSMNTMFVNNDKFNKPIGNWNISGCTDFHGMFFGAFAFYQDLSAWATTGDGFNTTQNNWDNFLNQGSQSKINREGSLVTDPTDQPTLQTQVLGGGEFTPTVKPEVDVDNVPVQATWENYNWPS